MPPLWLSLINASGESLHGDPILINEFDYNPYNDGAATTNTELILLVTLKITVSKE